MASFKELLFTYRSYTPIPFVVLALVFGRPTSALLLMGVMPALAGEAIRLWGVAYAGSLTRATGNVGAPSVVMAGPYAHVRNPLYIGNILMYVGFGVMSNALVPWLPLVALLFFSWQYRSIVSLEEEFLAKEFGESYLVYHAHVPKFFPRLKAYENPAQANQLPNWKEAFASERRTLQAFVVVSATVVLLWMVR